LIQLLAFFININGRILDKQVFSSINNFIIVFNNHSHRCFQLSYLLNKNKHVHFLLHHCSSSLKDFLLLFIMLVLLPTHKSHKHLAPSQRFEFNFTMTLQRRLIHRFMTTPFYKIQPPHKLLKNHLIVENDRNNRKEDEYQLKEASKIRYKLNGSVRVVAMSGHLIGQEEPCAIQPLKLFYFVSSLFPLVSRDVVVDDLWSCDVDGIGQQVQKRCFNFTVPGDISVV
jgi:hypothetical protein